MQHVNHVQRLLQQRFTGLSPSQQQVARYALDNPDEVAFLSAQQLAARTRVSQSTVVRFPAALGFEGYPQFQRALQEDLRRRLSPAERLGKAAPDGGGLFHEVFAAEAANLQQARDLVSDTDLDRSCDLLASAQRLYVVGLRSSFALAHLSFTLLSQVRPGVALLDTDAGLLAERVADVGPGDLLLAITYPRYQVGTTKLARYAKSAGADVIAVTDSYAAPIAEASDIVLRTPYEGVGFPTSHVGGLVVLRALSVGVATRCADAADRLERLEQIRPELAPMLLEGTPGAVTTEPKEVVPHRE